MSLLFDGSTDVGGREDWSWTTLSHHRRIDSDAAVEERRVNSGSTTTINDAVFTGTRSPPNQGSSGGGVTPAPEEPEHAFTTAGIWLLAILLLLLSLVLISLVAHILCYRRRRQMQQLLWFASSSERRREASGLDETTLRQRIEKRYETIEMWMIQKQVMAHDTFCSACLCLLAEQYKKNPDQEGYCRPIATTAIAKAESPSRSFLKVTSEAQQLQSPKSPCTRTPPSSPPIKCAPSSPSSKELTATLVSSCFSSSSSQSPPPPPFSCCGDSSQEEGGQECPICFEEFQVGDIVSFAPRRSADNRDCDECSHVFHHSCIKEWLLRNTTCPFCRKICIPTDDNESGSKQQGNSSNSKSKTKHVSGSTTIKEQQKLHHQRFVTTLYCVQDGLLSLPERVHCTDQELRFLLHRLQTSAVDKVVLAKQRKTSDHVKTYFQQQRQQQQQQESHHQLSHQQQSRQQQQSSSATAPSILALIPESSDDGNDVEANSATMSGSVGNDSPTGNRQERQQQMDSNASTTTTTTTLDGTLDLPSTAPSLSSTDHFVRPNANDTVCNGSATIIQDEANKEDESRANTQRNRQGKFSKSIVRGSHQDDNESQFEKPMQQKPTDKTCNHVNVIPGSSNGCLEQDMEANHAAKLDDGLGISQIATSTSSARTGSPQQMQTQKANRKNNDLCSGSGDENNVKAALQTGAFLEL
ncbi:hypothetical protein ACA910_017574 [Epithemia clementina (nom. ined.)]